MGYDNNNNNNNVFICPTAYTYDPVPGEASPGGSSVLYRGLSPWLPWQYPSQYLSQTCSDEFLCGLHLFTLVTLAVAG